MYFRGNVLPLLLLLLKFTFSFFLPSKPFVQNRQYYSEANSRANTWDNPYRSCKKIRKYFHDINTRYASTHPSDTDKIRASTAQATRLQKEGHIAAREVQRQQLQSRKAAREVLQYSSSQALTKGADPALAQEIATCSPAVSTEFVMQQSLGYKDPSKEKSSLVLLSPNHRYCYNDYGRRQLKGLLRPAVLKGDQGLRFIFVVVAPKQKTENRGM